jgi:trans-aconitate methyltransferase
VTGQRWDSDRYARNARFVSDLAAPVVEMLAPRPGERILDLGCGDGALTEKIAAAGARVVGVDSSPEMAAAATTRGLDVRVIDGARLPFEAEFDAVFSNAALHWMKDLEPVVAGVWKALVRGGRFVGETGGSGNVAAVSHALCDALAKRNIDAEVHYPWVFPSLDDFRSMLEARGFRVTTLELMPRPTPLPGAIDDWLEIFAGSFLALISAADRPAFVAEVRDALVPRLRTPDGGWFVDYVRLRFAALKP